MIHNDTKDFSTYNDLFISTRSAVSDPAILTIANPPGTTINLSQITRPIPLTVHPGGLGSVQNNGGLSLSLVTQSGYQTHITEKKPRKGLTNNSLPKIALGASRNASSMMSSAHI